MFKLALLAALSFGLSDVFAHQAVRHQVLSFGAFIPSTYLTPNPLNVSRT
jgi:hypothetical protein